MSREEARRLWGLLGYGSSGRDREIEVEEREPVLKQFMAPHYLCGVKPGCWANPTAISRRYYESFRVETAYDSAVWLGLLAFILTLA